MVTESPISRSELARACRKSYDWVSGAAAALGGTVVSGGLRLVNPSVAARILEISRVDAQTRRRYRRQSNTESPSESHDR